MPYSGQEERFLLVCFYPLRNASFNCSCLLWGPMSYGEQVEFCFKCMSYGEQEIMLLFPFSSAWHTEEFALFLMEEQFTLTSTF